MLNQIFCVHGFLINILSDRELEYITQFRRFFCKLIGARVSLTSGYHPETNGLSEGVKRLKSAPGFRPILSIGQYGPQLIKDILRTLQVLGCLVSAISQGVLSGSGSIKCLSVRVIWCFWL